MKKQEIFIYGKSKNLSTFDINFILESALNLSKERLFLLDEIDVEDGQKIKKIIDNVYNGLPIEYACNRVKFYSLDFFVDNRCLIPRNDTEIMVETALKEDFDVLIDVGTGSGAIPISIKKNYPKDIETFAVDIEEKALQVAKINNENHNTGIKLNNSSLLSAFMSNKDIFKYKKCLITANLPYIKNGDFENMDKSVIDNEPSSALYGGEKTGFELYEELISQCQYIKDNFSPKSLVLFIEIGFDQKTYSEQYLKALPIKFGYFQDANKIDRVIKIIF